MSEYTIRELNATTGEEIVRPATDDEIAQIEKDAADYALEQEAARIKAEKRTELLDRLGLTEDEAKLLLS